MPQSQNCHQYFSWPGPAATFAFLCLFSHVTVILLICLSTMRCCVELLCKILTLFMEVCNMLSIPGILLLKQLLRCIVALLHTTSSKFWRLSRLLFVTKHYQQHFSQLRRQAKCTAVPLPIVSLKIWLLHLLGINSEASYFSHSFLAWSNILWKTFSQLLLFCRRISSTLSLSSITANTSNSFFCSSFETGRIIPEVCCTTKVAIKIVHFYTALRNVAALVATSTCLFSCCNSSSVETTAGNSVMKMMIESCLSTQRVA